MTLMDRRRALMAAKSETLDTTAEIVREGVRWRGQSSDIDIVSATGKGITKQYFPNPLPAAGSGRLKVSVGATSESPFVLFADGAEHPFEYWGPAQPHWEDGAVSVSFTVVLSAIDNAYAYVIASGEVLFAGKNTPYYGKRKING